MCPQHPRVPQLTALIVTAPAQPSPGKHAGNIGQLADASDGPANRTWVPPSRPGANEGGDFHWLPVPADAGQT
jgi:hypothetical protein